MCFEFWWQNCLEMGLKGVISKNCTNSKVFKDRGKSAGFPRLWNYLCEFQGIQGFQGPMGTTLLVWSLITGVCQHSTRDLQPGRFFTNEPQNVQLSETMRTRQGDRPSHFLLPSSPREGRSCIAHLLLADISTVDTQPFTEKVWPTIYTHWPVAASEWVGIRDVKRVMALRSGAPRGTLGLAPVNVRHFGSHYSCIPNIISHIDQKPPGNVLRICCRKATAANHPIRRTLHT